MTAPVAIRQSDLRRATAMAKESGCVIEIERNGVKIRVMPDNPELYSYKPIVAGPDVSL